MKTNPWSMIYVMECLGSLNCFVWFLNKKSQAQVIAETPMFHTVTWPLSWYRRCCTTRSIGLVRNESDLCYTTCISANIARLGIWRRIKCYVFPRINQKTCITEDALLSNSLPCWNDTTFNRIVCTGSLNAARLWSRERSLYIESYMASMPSCLLYIKKSLDWPL